MPQGYWLNSPNEVASVAIKILQEGTSPSQNKELLEEARVMASVNHPCCVRLQAVCMTAHMMLISELLPTGSLLDYVRAQQYELSSDTLLLWAKQIAEVCMLSDCASCLLLPLSICVKLVNFPNLTGYLFLFQSV